MSKILEQLGICGVVPVVVLNEVKDAVPTAKALLEGGVNVIEITFRTAAAKDSIREVAESCPDMIVGAGTVITLEQCKNAVQMGAKFIVSPGFDEDVVAWCVENGIDIIPGCVTPSEIMRALKYGLIVLKFFPANVYGGISAMKALAGPFGGVKFIPTGGVNGQNLGEYISAPFVHAVGGSWLCSKADIAAGNFVKITELCREAHKSVLGFEFAHLGINCYDELVCGEVCDALDRLFTFSPKVGNSSIFSTSAIEVMKTNYLGANGHVAIRTNKIEAAIAHLESKGCILDRETAKFKGDKMMAVYLKDEIGGFAFHLLQK